MTNFVKVYATLKQDMRVRNLCLLGTEISTGGKTESCMGTSNVQVQLYQQGTYNYAGQGLLPKGIKIFLLPE